MAASIHFLDLFFTKPILTHVLRNVLMKMLLLKKKRDSFLILFLFFSFYSCSYSVFLDVFLPGAISQSHYIFFTFKIYFSQPSATESYFFVSISLDHFSCLQEIGDTCSTWWNGRCHHKDQNNWRPDKCLTEEILPSK